MKTINIQSTFRLNIHIKNWIIVFLLYNYMYHLIKLFQASAISKAYFSLGSLAFALPSFPV